MNAAELRARRARLKARMAALDAEQYIAEQAQDADTLRRLLAEKQDLLLMRRALDRLATTYTDPPRRDTDA